MGSSWTSHHLHRDGRITHAKRECTLLYVTVFLKDRTK
jgi:hypothetical protein